MNCLCLPVPLDDVDEIVGGGVVSERDVGVVDPVLAQDGLDQVLVQLGLRHHRLEVQAALLLLLEHDVWGSLVQSGKDQGGGRRRQKDFQRINLPAHFSSAKKAGLIIFSKHHPEGWYGKGGNVRANSVKLR